MWTKFYSTWVKLYFSIFPILRITNYNKASRLKYDENNLKNLLFLRCFKESLLTLLKSGISIFILSLFGTQFMYRREVERCFNAFYWKSFRKINFQKATLEGGLFSSNLTKENLLNFFYIFSLHWAMKKGFWSKAQFMNRNFNSRI